MSEKEIELISKVPVAIVVQFVAVAGRAGRAGRASVITPFSINCRI